MLMEFLLTLIPTWMIILSLSISVIIILGADIVKGIPFIGKYGYFIIPIGLMVVSLGVHLLTVKSVNSVWEEKVLRLEIKNNELKLKQLEVNKEIVKEYVEVPVEKIITRNKIIKEEIPLIINADNDCEIPKGAIELYNRSIQFD